ncbi:MAG: hypothetical protein E7409_07495 [Ruminococcaceae bacterium]|nr:hypothetical protein [Oscillospiraceae bacterium]
MENVVLERKKILSPMKDIPWASEMVLNPAIIEDPKTGRIHMLIRVTGPCAEMGIPGKKLPFPAFLSYAWSDDGGETYEFDWERPALAPALKYDMDELWVTDDRGIKVPNYANGSIQDPRLFWMEGECYCTVACRMFASGAYWIHDDPIQCSPDWINTDENPFGNAGNATVTVLYRMDLDALAEKDYDKAFTFVSNLTDPAVYDDRDVFLFEKKMKIDGKMQYVMLHRPYRPGIYSGNHTDRPTIYIAAAEDLYSFADKNAKRKVFYAPTEPWQEEKVGASTPPLDLGNGEWLLNYHGKKDAVEGYAQSFMILKEQDNDFPKITHLCKEKWLVNEEPFEEPHRFGIPCIFFTGLIPHKEDELLVAYGAADEHVAVMRLDYKKLMEELRKCEL